jgi:hypothetical protein
MAQEAKLTLPAETVELRKILEGLWPARLRALRTSGTPLNLYEELSDEQLKAKAAELGVQIAADADRATILAAVNADKPPAAPPWGDDANFDAERAWKLLEATRADREKLKTERDALAAKAKEIADAEKSETDKLTERATAAEKAAGESTLEAARLRVALKKGLTETQAKRLIGATEEELEADADELLLSFQNDDGRQDPDPLRRPRERLRPGAVPASELEETDPAKLAAMVPRRY